MTLAMPQSRLHLTPYQRVRRRAYEIMEGAVVDKYSRSIEVFVATLVVANVIAIILESVPEILQPHAAAFHAFDVFSGRTPLHLSSQNGHLETCRLLLQSNADVMAAHNL